MSSTGEGLPAGMSAWLEWQQKWWKEWAEKGAKGLASGWGFGAMDPSAWTSWWTDWYQSWQKALGWPPAPAEHVGMEVFGRLLEAGRVYQEFLGFWTRTMAPLMNLPPGTRLTSEHLKEWHENWLKEYQKVMETLWGTVPSPEAQETLKAWTSATAAWLRESWTTFEPVFKNLEGVPALLERVNKGDRTAVVELAGVFRKNYEATVGKALKAPSMGFWREMVERVNRTIDSYLEFQTALSQYFSLFYTAGQRAGEKVFARLTEFQGREITTETFREFYQLWWTINEETYHELFITEEFIGMLQEVLRRGLLFRKWFDELLGEFFKLVNLPTKEEMDEIYRTIYELRKEVRWQRRAIHELEQKLGIEMKKPKITGT